MFMCNSILRGGVSVQLFYPTTSQSVRLCVFIKKNGISTWSFLHQKEEEAAEGAKEAEREGGAKDGSAGRLHRRWWRLIHVFPQHHQ